MDKNHNFHFVLTFTILFYVTGCTNQSKQWDGRVLKNDLIELTVVPEIGGRIIQYKLGEYGFFWVNPELVNTVPPASGLAPDGSWLNYGGDKLWPAPQGWDNDRQWPGPPDAVLDGQPYELENLQEDDSLAAVKLTSDKDMRSGIQFSRVVRLFENSTRVSIDATMKNIDNKPRRWGIWTHTQLDAGNRHGEGYNENFRAYCPFNPDSVFPKGYDVLFGLVNNTSYQPDYDEGIMKIKYTYRVGKIGMDSHAGWVATVNAADGYVFAHRFTYEPDKSYPENSSVEFWLNGLGEFVAWGKVNQMPEGPRLNPYIFETEVLSPFAYLQPGEQYTYHYDWYTAMIPPDCEVIACNDIGAVCEPLSAKTKNGSIILNGKFGIFHDGFITVEILGEHGRAIPCKSNKIPVSPLIAFELLDHTIRCDSAHTLTSAKTARLIFHSKDGKLIDKFTSSLITD